MRMHSILFIVLAVVLYMEPNGERVILFIRDVDHQVTDCVNINKTVIWLNRKEASFSYLFDSTKIF